MCPSKEGGALTRDRDEGQGHGHPRFVPESFAQNTRLSRERYPIPEVRIGGFCFLASDVGKGYTKIGSAAFGLGTSTTQDGLGM